MNLRQHLAGRLLAFAESQSDPKILRQMVRQHTGKAAPRGASCDECLAILRGVFSKHVEEPRP